MMRDRPPFQPIAPLSSAANVARTRPTDRRTAEMFKRRKRFVIEVSFSMFGYLFFKQIHLQRSLERPLFPHITSSPRPFAELSIPLAFRNRFGATQREAFRRILLVTSIAPIFLPILPLSGGGAGRGRVVGLLWKPGAHWEIAERASQFVPLLLRDEEVRL